MNKEVEELLDKLGSMEDAPLIWINKKVGDLLEENQKFKHILDELENYLEKNIVDAKAGGSQQYYFKTVYEFLKELRGDKNV